jgi:ABC-type transport system involved in cytochrome c biogenesis permease component
MKAIVRKDIQIVRRSKGVMIPLIIVPLIFFILIPLLASLTPSLVNMPGLSLTEFDTFLQRMPGDLQSAIEPYAEDQKIIVMMVLYFFAPMFLIVPLMVSSVIAADSFAGEKERKTIEALLYTPTTDGELFLSKVFSAWLPALIVSLAGFVIYGVTANAAGWRTMGGLFFPNWMWVVMVLWVAPAAAGLGLGTMVLVSSRVESFQEANQLGGVIVLPIVALVIGQASGVMYFSTRLVLLLGAILWMVDGILLWFGIKVFERERMITGL